MSIDGAGSVTNWIADLKKRQPDTQRKIWERFAKRLENYANKILAQRECWTLDGEDIVSMTFTSLFFRDPSEFSRLVDRNDLWQLLAMIAQRRVIDQVRRDLSVKKGCRKTFSEADILAEEQGCGMDDYSGQLTSPDVEILLAEELECRLEGLGDPTLRVIAICRMQDFSNVEIAEKLGIGLRSVERKLAQIRSRFEAANC